MSQVVAKQTVSMSPEVEVGLATYATALRALFEAHHAATHRTLTPESVRVEVRQKYAKVIHGTSVYSYVDLTTGDVLKGTWKGPERAVLHIKRGNVTNGTWLDWHGPYGIGYADSHGEFRSMLNDAEYMIATDAIKMGDATGAAATLRDAIAERYAAHRAAHAGQAVAS